MSFFQFERLEKRAPESGNGALDKRMTRVVNSSWHPFNFCEALKSTRRTGCNFTGATSFPPRPSRRHVDEIMAMPDSSMKFTVKYSWSLISISSRSVCTLFEALSLMYSFLLFIPIRVTFVTVCFT